MQEDKKKYSWRLLFGAFMVFIYLGMAAVLAFSQWFDLTLVYRLIFAFLFLVYGVFRAYRLWKSGI